MILAPLYVPSPRPCRRVRTRPAASIDFNEGLALAGKFLGSWVLFTSSMNWWRYKRDRESIDRENKNR